MANDISGPKAADLFEAADGGNIGNNSGIADLAHQFASFHDFKTLDISGLGAAPAAVVPAGKSIASLKPILDEYRTTPERRRGTSQLRDTASFIEITRRFKSEESAVFALPDRSAPKIVSIFDYHPRGGTVTEADWLKHRAEYAPQLSEEWKAWQANNGKAMDQAAFAAFVEERITDLVVPNLDDPKLKTFADLVEGKWASPSDMVALSRKLQINVESTVRNAQTLSSGEVSIIYEEQHNDGAGQPLKVPNLFTIAIPVFYAGDLYRLPARLRYRVNGGKITWMYQLVRPDLAFDDAFKGIVAKVATETELPVYLGTPEAA